MDKPNINYIIELADGDLEFQNQIISILKKELPLEIEEFQNNIKNKEFKKSAENVHKLKHKINILGLQKEYELANEFEKQLINSNLKLENSFMDTIKKITIYLKNIPHN
ncbi:Hpt domain-containing protein [Lutibacter sp. Hel_I_33_5]|uniref:Hpt domain-containing protein n=1 Tax=Lutibacter sp. Hel_I_33_5 TaxID=1566289 RepID=UPI00119FEB6A|nr:Hpt domain-containing protein [Lutibacter sp. Hel_I_33_5]TVZ55582.1 Hpt domain-containing protein [Lutibacter sp. Hel_I_33_5]